MGERSDDRELPISDDDVRAAVRLVGEAAGLDAPPEQRRRAILSGLAALIGADVWVWMHSTGWRPGGAPALLGFVEGGYADDAERNRLHRANTNDEWVARAFEHVDLTRPSTVLGDAVNAGIDPYLMEKVVRPAGFEALLFSFHPQTDGVMSGIGLHRRTGGRPYTAREQALAHLVLDQVPWLHAVTPPPVVEEPGLLQMTAREREALVYLLDGDSRKQVARHMSVSVHTVGDYFKSIYRRLNVSSRGELMAKFMARPPARPAAGPPRSGGLPIRPQAEQSP